MNHFLVYIPFIFITFMAIVIVIYPLRKKPLLSLSTSVFTLIIIVVAYWQWGGFQLWQEQLEKDKKQKLVQSVMEKVKDPQELIDKLKAKLAKDPDSAKGWYLLGRLYASQGMWEESEKAHQKAFQLEPGNESYLVYYANAVWQANNRQFSSKLHNLLDTLLRNNPNQPDALAMLAMQAFMSHDYERAVNFWQKLLSLAPPQSEEANALRKAIAKAIQKIKEGKNHGKSSL